MSLSRPEPGDATDRLLSPFDTAGASRLMVLVVAIFGIISSLLGERVPAGGGLGWDGLTYGRMVRELGPMIENGLLSSYYAQRVLPAAIVRVGLTLTGAGFGDQAIIRGFQVYNFVLVIGVVLLWWRLANDVALTVRGRWLGFVGLFVTFQASKLLFYYPVLTDSTALFLGMVLLTAYVEKRPWILFVAAVLGSLAWPVASYQGAFLLLFVGARLPEAMIEPVAAVPSRRTGTILIVVALVAALVAMPALQVAWKLTDTPMWKWMQAPITAAPSWVALGVALAMMAGSMAFFREVVLSLLRPRLGIALAVAAVLVPALLVRTLSDPAVAAPSGLGTVVWLAAMPPTNKVLLPLVSALAFWGPLVVVLVLRWPDVAVEARRLGVGFAAVIALTLFLALPNEPRYLTAGWPFLVVAGVLAMERRPDQRFDLAFVALSIVCAQFWAKLNLAPWTGDDNEGLTSFPKQVYFMHYGLWMGWPAFLAYGTLAAVGLVILRSRPRPKEGP